MTQTEAPEGSWSVALPLSTDPPLREVAQLRSNVAIRPVLGLARVHSVGVLEDSRLLTEHPHFSRLEPARASFKAALLAEPNSLTVGLGSAAMTTRKTVAFSLFSTGAAYILIL